MTHVLFNWSKSDFIISRSGLHLHSGHLGDSFIQSDSNQVHYSERDNRETKIFVFGTVRMIIETIAKH